MPSTESSSAFGLDLAGPAANKHMTAGGVATEDLLVEDTTVRSRASAVKVTGPEALHCTHIAGPEHKYPSVPFWACMQLQQLND